MAVLLGIVWGSHAAYAQTNRLTVGEAVRLSLEYHPRLGVARAARAAATAALGEAKSSRIPGAQAQASLTRFQEPMIVAPLHRFDVTSPPRFDPALVQSRLTIAYTLFDGGGRGGRVGQAKAAAASAGSEITSAHMTVIEDVTTAYLSALTASGIDDANRSAVTALESERRRTQQLLTEGRAARVELLRVDAALAQARAERIASHAESDFALRTLARLVGWDADSIVAAQLVGVNLVARSIEPSLNERAKRANPDLESARHRAAAEHA
ncbi:MAG: TolC family protein, partial [Gemmatimonadales bacterium]